MRFNKILKLIEIKDLEYCLYGAFFKDLRFNSFITSDFIYYLGEMGELEYYPDFASPFYKIEIPNEFILKGIEDKNKATIILCRKNINQHFKNFTYLIDKYNLEKEGSDFGTKIS